MLLSDNNIIDNNQYFKWMNSIILETVDDLRRLCAHLRPSALDRLGLVPALRLLIDKVNKECGIELRFLVNGEEYKLPANVEITFFRVMQEALNNIRRHSKATTAIISVYFNNNSFKVVIEDNGQGFDTSRIKEITNSENRLGLAGMRWRMESIGGLLRIDSKPGESTIVMAEIDLNKYKNMLKSKTYIAFRNEFDTQN
jgi:two-component system sensor histidine kinase DegS